MEEKRLLKRKSRRLSRRALKRRIRLALAVTLVILAGCMAFGITSYAKSTHSPRPVYKYYTDIRIRHGDTLSSIADRYYTTEFRSKSAYIEDVKRINHLSSDRIIAGRMLIVPYYSVIEKH